MLIEFDSWLKVTGRLAKTGEVATQRNGAGKTTLSQELPQQKLLQCAEG